MKKYELTDETKVVSGLTLHRIKAVRDIEMHGVRAGDRGGWIMCEDNLSQYGNAWVGGHAMVCDNGRVCDNGLVCDNGVVRDHGLVCDNGVVCDHGCVRDYGCVRDIAAVRGNGVVRDHTLVCGDNVVNSDGASGIEICVRSNLVPNISPITYSVQDKLWCAGHFCGNREELIAKAFADDKHKGECYKIMVEAVERIAALNAAKKNESEVAE